MNTPVTDPQITRTDFLTMPSQNVFAAVEFYEQVLGLRCAVRPNDDQRMPYAEVETGSLTLGFIEPARMNREFKPNPGPLALHVDDVEASRARLIERGVQFHADTLDSGVCHMAFFADPDGNGLMLHNRYAPK